MDWPGLRRADFQRRARPLALKRTLPSLRPHDNDDNLIQKFTNTGVLIVEIGKFWI